MHHLFFRVRANDVNSTKSQPKIFIWWINKMTSDKRWQAKFSGILLRWKQFLSFKNCRSVSICSVLNRSNRDTTVYYRLIFCAFSWPNMVKWRNSGIIIIFISFWQGLMVRPKRWLEIIIVLFQDRVMDTTSMYVFSWCKLSFHWNHKGWKVSFFFPSNIDNKNTRLNTLNKLS